MVSRETELKNWKFKKSNSEQWYKSKHGSAATEIFLDLEENGLIPDPFISKNELQVQWVSEADWEYQCEFIVPEQRTHQNIGTTHQLLFEGLDTYAEVYLNEKKVFVSKNQFVTHKVLVTDYLVAGVNKLRIYFHSALLKGRALESRHGKLIAANGEDSRVHVRKTQYHYGWDWGPKLLSCGPYRPIRLLSYDIGRVADVFVRPVLSDDLQTCSVQVSIELDLPEVKNSFGLPNSNDCDDFIDLATEFDDYVVIESQSKQSVLLKIDVWSPSLEVIASKIVEVTSYSSKTQFVSFTLKSPQLWFPVGYGPQALYSVNAYFVDEHDASYSSEFQRDFGIRKAKLVQQPFKDVNEEGASFYFEVNNILIFAGGSNWIPSDSLVTRTTDENYTQLLNLLVESNQKMVRVWGGGYYESDHFYQECDRLGILVFQDLMFACGQYPCYYSFERLVTKELESQLKRLRNYTSIVLIAGNNEDYLMAKLLGYSNDESRKDNDYRDTTFPARTLYEKVFPENIQKYWPDVQYQPSSPYGSLSGESNPNSTKVGDVHAWDVWHGTQEKYQNWSALKGRFVSEFGMESLPSLETLSLVVTDPGELYPQSEIVEFHNKAGGFESRLAKYVMENFRIKCMELENWVYLTQLLQSECLSFAYKLFRREWKNDGERYVGGALVWQLNDCWPCASWSIVDYFKKPKLAYYALKRELQPVTIALFRNEYLKGTTTAPPPLLDTTHDYRPRDYLLDIWGTNITTESKSLAFKYEIYSIYTGRLLSESTKLVNLGQNQRTDIIKGLNLSTFGNQNSIAIVGKLLDKPGGEVIARAYDWPQPLKRVKFNSNTFVQYRAYTDYVIVSTNRPVKGVLLTTVKDGKVRDIEFEDNGFDLCPGDAKVVKVKGFKFDDRLSIKYYS